MAPNVLLITLDQFRGDCLSSAGHPVVRTPNLDALSAEGVRFARHFSQSSPCSPGRASLYTGTYQMNHRVVANGTPLDARFDNVALAARRAGMNPVLFGYTDQSIDPRDAAGPDDPRLSRYEGILPGFDCLLDLSGSHAPWLEWLAGRGVHVDSAVHALSTEHERPAELSVSRFMTDRLIEWIGAQDGNWFAHASYIRPHPPYSAAGEWSAEYAEDSVGEPIAPVADPEKFHELMLQLESTRAPADAAGMRRMRAQYFGMVSEVDHQLGRLWAALRESGRWDDTVIIVTADHAELLGDHGLREKVGYWETSQHIPCIIRDPRRPAAHGTVVDVFTENVDIMPTLCEVMGLDVPHQCDGLPLTPFLEGAEPPWWRTAAHWEYDWRFALIQLGVEFAWPWKRSLEKQNLCVHRTDDIAYVQFGDGRHLCFDLAADPTWRTECTDQSRVLRAAQELLTWRMQMTERQHTGFLVEHGGTGRWPAGVPWRD
ncbi:MAG: sulfatase-like hydrolase/transferase [Actinomycetota bacterium]